MILFPFTGNAGIIEGIPEKILESLKTEPELWCIDENKAVYFRTIEDKTKAMEYLFPESNGKAVIYIRHSVFGPSRYVNLQKPEYGFLSEYNKDLAEEIEEVLRFRLYQDLANDPKVLKFLRNIKPKIEQKHEKNPEQKIAEPEKETGFKPL